ncbi:ATP-binding protein [Schaalia suimastitidis]|uniref:ATP-binding protein n=1 Tax=Schaalia suimastitidis TaxID=121163 RepID=UPI00041BF102|nr:ATP-binding protein [Schaalia suimastitidis]
MELLERNVAPWLDEVLGVSPIAVVEGARQVGKSTLVSMLGDDSTVFTTMDDDATRAYAHDDPIGFLAAAGQGCLVIDEIQRCPELILPLKAVVDADRRPGRFILTGSANLLRLPGAEDSLAGRAMTVRLHPFSQGEIAGVKEDWVTWLLQADREPSPVADRTDIIGRLVTGGFPTVQGLSSRMRTAWLRDYANRLVERDAADVATAQTSVLRKLLLLLAAAPGAELVQDRLAQELGVARGTVARYLDLLESLFLVQRLPSWSRNLTKRQVQRPKCYLTDSGLAVALSGLNAQHLASFQGSDHLGPLVESFVIGELTRQQAWSSTEYQLSHYRDRDGAEIDVIIETPQGVIAVEVKSAVTAISGHFKHVRGLRDRLGDEFLAGVVLTAGTGQRAGDRLESLPITSLWLGGIH